MVSLRRNVLALLACICLRRGLAFGLPAAKVRSSTSSSYSSSAEAPSRRRMDRSPPRRRQQQSDVSLNQVPLTVPAEGGDDSINGSSNNNLLSTFSAVAVSASTEISKTYSSSTVKKLSLSAIVLTLALSQRQLLSSASLAALEAYKSSLVVRPVRTKVLTGASLAVIGDYLAQAKEPTKPYDIPRAISFAAFDSCYRLFQHRAIPFIVALGSGRVFQSALRALPLVGGSIAPESIAFFEAMERTFLYQFGLIPFFYYPVFFTFTGFIQGLSMRETIQRAKTSFFPCWKRNLLFWIPIQMIMFGLVDEKWQIPFVCVMGIIWSLILSVTAGKAKADH